MSYFLILAFLFFIGSVSGWVTELIFRRFFSSANPERKWINPGFCTGPYLPIYGFGLCIMFLIFSFGEHPVVTDPFWNWVLLLVIASAAMTLIEYIAGVFCLKVTKVRLWDYTGQWGNIQGIICPKFSLIWTVVAAGYSMLIHPHVLDSLRWFSNNLAFSFVVGMFFGVFIIDVVNSAQLVVRIKKFAEDNEVIVRYEAIKVHIREAQDRAALRHQFFRPFRSERPLNEHLKEMLSTFESRKKTEGCRTKPYCQLMGLY